MANNRKQRRTLVTKKHQARLDRERVQGRYILIGTLATAVIAVLLVVYGVLIDPMIKQTQPVAVVNGEKIKTSEFQEQVRYQRLNIINNATSMLSFASQFGDSPEIAMQIASQLQQAVSQLAETNLGQEVLNQMIQDKLIRQEAEKRGIQVSEEEVENSIREAFGFFPDGTPTPAPTIAVLPTSTLSSMQMTLVPPTPTATATDVPTMTATLEATPTLAPTATAGPTATNTAVPSATPTDAPTAVPTEYTLESYEQNYQEAVTRFKDEIDFGEKSLRMLLESSLYRKMLQDAVLDELGVKPEEEQVWARHILVADENLAKVILEKVKAGEDWYSLAQENSEDPGSASNGGDLGWFGKGRMVAEFENAAFSLQVGEIVSAPVKSSFGYHIIQVLGREVRSLADADYQSLREQRFDEWLNTLREASTVEISDFWLDRVPTEPALPPEVQQYILSAQQQQQQQLPLPTP